MDAAGISAGMPSIKTDDRVVARDAPVASTVDDELVVLNERTGEYQGLTGIGPEVWDCIQEPITIGTVVDHVMAEYDVDHETCTADVRDFVADLIEHDLAERAEDGPG